MYVGLSRIITCTWIGLEDLIKLDWYLVGLEGLGIGMKLYGHTIALSTGRITDINWNGKQYVCRAATASGIIVGKNVSLWVKGHYLKVIIINFR